MLKSARNTDRWINKLVKADCLALLKRLETESIDLIATDPPYGLHFLGKDWDKAIPSVKVWDECFRVLKAGSFIFVMSAPRMDLLYRMSYNLETVGFDIGFTPIFWTYSSGFPKAMNIGKAVDQRAGVEREVIGHYQYPDGHERPSAKEDMGFVQEFVKKHSNTYHTKRIVDRLAITKPATTESQKLDGSYAGYQPKPAVEVIIVGMKPLSEESYIDQALWNMKGITWLDDCRIPIVEWFDFSKKTRRSSRRSYSVFETSGFKSEKNTKATPSQSGRFPSNLIVSNDILNDGTITRSNSGGTRKSHPSSYFGRYPQEEDSIKQEIHDEGSFSRFFDLDVWFIEKFKHIPKEKLELYPFAIYPKPTTLEKEKGLEKFTPQPIKRSRGLIEQSQNTPKPFAKNTHPTVKPVKLMAYLVTLGSRENDIVLDPFVGSGTTAVACKMINRKYIGCDINKEWLRIATRRVKAVVKSFDLKELIE